AALGQPTNCSLQVDTFFLANPDLSSEQSTQWSVGVVYDPVEWLDLSLDYYNIEVEDTISSIGAQDIINSDLDPATYGPIPPGLSITRAANGRITEIIAGYANQGILTNKGWDFRANTNFDLGNWGELSNSLQVSKTVEFEIDDGLGNISCYVGCSSVNGYPDLRAVLLNNWTIGDFTFGWNVNYIGDNGPNGGYATNDVQLSWKAPWNATIAVGAINAGNR